MEKDPKPRVEQAMSTFSETFGLNRMAAISVVVFAGVVILAGLFWFIRSAPPRTLIAITRVDRRAAASNASPSAIATSSRATARP